MPVDADDLVSNKLAEFFVGKNDGKCYTSKFGFIWNSRSAFLTKTQAMYDTCGSCSIVYCTPNDLPENDFEHMDKTKKFIFQNKHREVPDYAEKVGKERGIVPFPTTVYVMNTGENHSLFVKKGRRFSVKRSLEGLLRVPQPITKKLRNEFNLKAI